MRKRQYARVVFNVSLKSMKNLIRFRGLEWVKKNHPEAYEEFKNEL